MQVRRTHARPSVGVIGSGVAGITAAYLLQRAFDVTLFEADPRPGGHAHTHDVPTPDGRLIPIDTGFIVHNERTYPNLLRLFAELGIVTKASEMSMSIRCDGCGLEYAGAKGLRGIAATPSALLKPKFLRLLVEVKKFHRQAERLLASSGSVHDPEADAGADSDGVTLGGFLDRGRYSRYFASHFMLPFVSAVWSSGIGDARRYPARYLFEFFAHHGMLTVSGSPVWKTVEGGSRSYVERAVKGLTALATQTPVRSVRRTGARVEIRDDCDTVHTMDRVVVATHPDQALALLADPTRAEADILGSFTYSRNETIFHTDGSILPRRAAAAASWNYRMAGCDPMAGRELATSGVGDSGVGGGARAQVSYHMNRLHQIDEPVDYVVTLGGPVGIDPSLVLSRLVYEHPIYTPQALAAQRRLPNLTSQTTAYAGAYHGWGFHEDGCVSGVRAAAAFGAGW